VFLKNNSSYKNLNLLFYLGEIYIMEEYIKTISADNQKSIVDYLNETILPHMIINSQGAAKGRRQLWIQTAPPLTSSATWHVGFEDERIMNYIRLISPPGFTPEAVLVTKGGNIKRHRDARYADYRGMSINLGKVTWYYERSNDQYFWQPGLHESVPVGRYDLTGGEVFMFNTKNPHWVENAHPDRWGINVWQISKNTRDDYDKFMENRANGNLTEEQLDYKVAGY
jgi:hypothetical protein